MTNFNNTKMDLGLDLSQWKKNSNPGAGANANLQADLMNFVSTDTLAELVWLPQTGLNIKYSENKPCSMWEEGPSEMRNLDTQNEEHITSLATHHVIDEVLKSSGCTGSQNQGAAATLFHQLYENEMTSNVNNSGSESRLPLGIEPMMQCGHQEHVERDIIEMHDVKMEKDDFSSDPFLENAQVAILKNEDDENHDAASDGSMGSCTSANFFNKRKRECNFEQHLVLGGKRIKKDADEYATKTDHSFMNWISNMFKGLKTCNIYDQKLNVSNQNILQSLFLPEHITRIENKSIGSSVLAKRSSQESLDDHMEIQNEDGKSLVKQVSLYEGVSKEAPKAMFDAVRRLRLSRTDIHKWMNSQLPVSQLDGFFLRLRVTKWEEGAEGSRYYVACITGLQWGTPWKDLKQPIRVKVGDVECFVESQHVSNCDFIEDELIAWWQKTSKDQRIPVVKDLKSKLAVRRTLGM